MDIYLLKAFLKFHSRRAKFSRKQLEELFETISDRKFCVLPLNHFRKIKDSTRVLIGLRFDVDFDPYKALKLSQVASLYGICGTFFFLATAWYAGRIKRNGLHRNNLDWLYKEVYELGNEIAIHNDLLTVQIKYKLDPFEFNRKELDYYHSLGIPIHGTSAHGSSIAKVTCSNYEIFSDFATVKMVNYKGNIYTIGRNILRDYGFEYEAYHLDDDTYYSDANGCWNLPGGFDELISRLKTAQRGQRIQILIHPEYYPDVNNLQIC